MSLYHQTAVGIDADTPIATHVHTDDRGVDHVHVRIGEHGELAVFGKQADVVAFFHRVVAALSPIEERLHAEKLIREQLGLELEPTSTSKWPTSTSGRPTSTSSALEPTT